MEEPVLIEAVPLAQIDASPTQPRKSFPDVFIKELADSIDKTGLKLRPVLRKKVKDRYEIVDGECRIRAMKLLGLKEIVCEIRDLSDEEVRELQLTTFLLKTGLNPIEEANAYADWSKAGRSPEDIAARTAKPLSHILRMLSLLKLIPTAKKAFDDGTLPLAHALEICRLQPKDQEKAREYAFDGFKELNQVCSLKDLREFIEEQIHLDLREAAFSKTDAKLCPAAGACVNCPKRTGFSKELFNDITKADTCTDPKCFHEKQMAHLANVKADLKEKKIKFVEITREHQKPAGHEDAITYRSFTELKGDPSKHCKYAIKGILIDGSKKGTVIPICRSKECGTHNGARRREHGLAPAKPAVTKSAEQVEKERIAKVKERVKERTEELLTLKLWKPVGSAVPKKLPRKALMRVAVSMLNRASNKEDEIMVMVGKKWSAWQFEKSMNRFSESELIHIINCAIIADQEDDEPGYLIDQAKALKVNVAQFEAQAKAEAEKEFAEQLKPVDTKAETAAAIAHSKTATTAVGVGTKKTTKKK